MGRFVAKRHSSLENITSDRNLPVFLQISAREHAIDVGASAFETGPGKYRLTLLYLLLD